MASHPHADPVAGVLSTLFYCGLPLLHEMPLLAVWDSATWGLVALGAAGVTSQILNACVAAYSRFRDVRDKSAGGQLADCKARLVEMEQAAEVQETALKRSRVRIAELQKNLGDADDRHARDRDEIHGLRNRLDELSRQLPSFVQQAQSNVAAVLEMKRSDDARSADGHPTGGGRPA